MSRYWATPEEKMAIARQIIGAKDRCPLCTGNGEVWISGEMIPCICEGVRTLIAQLQDENERLRAMIDAARSLEDDE